MKERTPTLKQSRLFPAAVQHLQCRPQLRCLISVRNSDNKSYVMPHPKSRSIANKSTHVHYLGTFVGIPEGSEEGGYRG